MDKIGDEIRYRRAHDPKRTGSLVLDRHRDDQVREMRSEGAPGEARQR